MENERNEGTGKYKPQALLDQQRLEDETFMSTDSCSENKLCSKVNNKNLKQVQTKRKLRLHTSHYS